MQKNHLLIILGNQLFPLEEILKINCKTIFMKEDLGLCTYFKHHKMKILYFLTAMREYRDYLIQNNFNVASFTFPPSNVVFVVAASQNRCRIHNSFLFILSSHWYGNW